jgi:hypothetical protein
MRINAIWGIPRSGLVFRKVSKWELALDELMPYTREMGAGFKHGFDVPPTPEDLKHHQIQDFETISKRFIAAGITVTDPKGLLHN